jgi:hypothetical protein
VLVVPPPRSPGCVALLCAGVADLLDDGYELVVCDVGDFERPDLLALDAVARMQLTARRVGCSIVLRHANQALADLIGLAGLDDVIRPWDPPEGAGGDGPPGTDAAAGDTGS